MAVAEVIFAAKFPETPEDSFGIGGICHPFRVWFVGSFYIGLRPMLMISPFQGLGFRSLQEVI